MRIVVALGGNALLRRGEPLSALNQRENIRIAAKALAPIAMEHELVITHGNGPQVGLLALQSAAYNAEESYPLDILGAETEGMIGYLIEQEMGNVLPFEKSIVTLLTQIEVDRDDPAFENPTKPIGPIYPREQADQLARERGWAMAADGDSYRRVVASPRPKRIFELKSIRLLLEHNVLVICSGGGGIPCVYQEDRSLTGVEAVIDKDHAGALLAQQLQADRYLMLTDVPAVVRDWGENHAKSIQRASPAQMARWNFAAGSMGPKVEAACEFVKQSNAIAGIGRLQDAQALLNGSAGTTIDATVHANIDTTVHTTVHTNNKTTAKGVLYYE
jgi:carbamate kinase